MRRQPIHTLYGGAHLFDRDTIGKMSVLASRHLLTYAGDCFAFAEALELPEAEEFPRTENGRTSILRRFRRRGMAARSVHPAAWFAFSLYERVLNKLRTEAVEDYRIDFEDGYGVRSDAEEDRDAVRCAGETAAAAAQEQLPAYFGIRIKPMTPEYRGRGERTLGLFMRELLESSEGRLPQGCVVTLPKVSTTDEVASLGGRLEEIERQFGLPEHSIMMECMVEHPRLLAADAKGTVLVQLIRAGGGRMRGVHLGLYDFLSSLGIVGSQQSFGHPSADHLRSTVSVLAASENIWIADGAVNTIPMGKHRAERLTRAQKNANRQAVHRAWREIFEHVTHSLRFGYSQGWDLHPSQMVPRLAATYALFFREYDRATTKLQAFVRSSARARVEGQTFDDIATGRGLLEFFLRGYACGAFSRQDIESSGFSLKELQLGSFRKLVEARAASSKQKGSRRTP